MLVILLLPLSSSDRVSAWQCLCFKEGEISSYQFHLKRPWCWKRVKAGGQGNDRGWDGWTASLTQRTWVWVDSESWWWTGMPGVLQSMGLERVQQDWATVLNWTELNRTSCMHAVTSVMTPCDPMDHSPPGYSVHGVLQTRILEWVAMPSSWGSSQPRDQIHVSCLLNWQAGSLPLAPPGKPPTPQQHRVTLFQKEGNFGSLLQCVFVYGYLLSFCSYGLPSHLRNEGHWARRKCEPE